MNKMLHEYGKEKKCTETSTEIAKTKSMTEMMRCVKEQDGNTTNIVQKNESLFSGANYMGQMTINVLINKNGD